MIIGDHLRFLREQRKLSQGDIEERTGLLRCYISRVENNHTTPSVETLEKMARAMEMCLYQVLYDGPEPPEPPKPAVFARDGWGMSGKDARLLTKLRRYLSLRNRDVFITRSPQRQEITRFYLNGRQRLSGSLVNEQIPQLGAVG
jgi:transcriptional regulator with XRE-family HTH domain